MPFTNEQYTNAFTIAAVTGVLTFIGGTAWVGSLTSNFAAPPLAASLAVAVAAGTSVLAVNYWNVM